MKADPVEVGIILDNRRRYNVPIYQRHYEWGRQKELPQFWNDVRTKAVEQLSGKSQRYSHYLGALVIEQKGVFSARQVQTYQVVDGQQRLTTFQVFLAAARDYALSVGMNDSADAVVRYLKNDNPKQMQDPDVEIYKVWPTEFDRELFQDIINGPRKELRKKYRTHFYATRDKIYPYKTVPRLLSAYGFFFDQIKYAVESDDLYDDFSPEPELDLELEEGEASAETAVEVSEDNQDRFDALWVSLVEGFRVVEIILEEGDDAQVIFETLNERGKPLTAAALVKNNIYYRIEGGDTEREKVFKKAWQVFEHRFWEQEEKQGRYKKPRLEFFLSNFIAAKTADDVNISKLFSEYKSFLKRSAKLASGEYHSVSDELEDLTAFGEIYREIIERNNDSFLAQFSRRLEPWDVTTVYPLVLRIMKSEMLEEEKELALNNLLSLIARRAIQGLGTKNYNKFFLSVIASLDKTEWTYGQFSKFLLETTAESGRFPRDEEFRHSFLNKPAYRTIGSRKANAVLREIELCKRTQFNETVALANSLSVEHIMPQQWYENWLLEEGRIPDYDERMAANYVLIEDDTFIGKVAKRNRMKETFGNLTLLTKPLNSSVSNGSFETKCKALKKHSLLVMNREISERERWDEEEILSRGEKLAKIAIDIWGLPNS